MKVAPLVDAIRARNLRARACGIQCLLVHTGQHYDEKMSQIFFKELGIPAPDVNLDVGSGSHASQTALIMLRIEPVLLREKPDWLVVVGDVNSTLACTIVAAKMGVKVAHVEAGLRSGDRSMPEEINRIVTDCISNLLLTPSIGANEILQREGVPAEKIRMVGNIMIDSVVAHLNSAERAGTLGRFKLAPEEFVYVTLHRPANVDTEESLASILTALVNVAARLPVVFPIHPRTRFRMGQFGLEIPSHVDLRLVDPVGYFDSLMLTKYARCVITDSGGLQEESTFFRTPCLTLRPNTERPITISLGSNKLTNPARLGSDLEMVLCGPNKIGAIPEYWEGKTADRVIEALLNSA